MAMVKGKNEAMKAFTNYVNDKKEMSKANFAQWEMFCNTKPATTKEPYRKVWGQGELIKLYRKLEKELAWFEKHEGASKITFTKFPNGIGLDGVDIPDFVVKILKRDAWMARGNQIVREINCFEELLRTGKDDCVCPIYKYFTCKSDKVNEYSEKVVEKCMIIAQKATDIGDARTACKKAEELNRKNGYRGESAEARYEKMDALAKEMHWWDAMKNPGNSGVIFDRYRNCYKAVFIDYAL